jgi:hypothetical protein
MALNESDFKTHLVKRIRAEGGYGRRVEDQFAVGVFDVILIPKGGPVFFVECKIIRASTWGATPRQRIELERIQQAGGDHVMCCELGFDPKLDIVEIRVLNSSIKLAANWKGLNVSAFLDNLGD